MSGGDDGVEAQIDVVTTANHKIKSSKSELCQRQSPMSIELGPSMVGSVQCALASRLLMTCTPVYSYHLRSLDCTRSAVAAETAWNLPKAGI